MWERALALASIDASNPRPSPGLPRHFSLSAAQIAQAARDAAKRLEFESTAALAYADLAAAARLQCGAELRDLAQRIAPQATFDSLGQPQPRSTRSCAKSARTWQRARPCATRMGDG